MSGIITAEEFDDFVCDLGVEDVAAVAPQALTDLVGDWSRVSAVSFAAETRRFAASNSIAAMLVGLTIRLTDAPPVLRSVTIIVEKVERRLRLDRIDVVATDPEPTRGD